MTAVQITEYGSTDKLTITGATGRSEPGEGQVLVRVTAASINRIDAALTAGYLSHMFPLQLPVTVGGDFSGTVVVKPGGRMVSMATRHDVEAAAAAGVEATTQMTQPKADVLTALVRLVDEGVIRQRISGTFPVAEARAAFAASQKGGKTIITLRG